ncbi:MAG TPA: hypothetical protein VNX47_07470 [Nevskia sp.]|nr:hypothetical protein [Nevskia sp.]
MNPDRASRRGGRVAAVLLCLLAARAFALEPALTPAEVQARADTLKLQALQAGLQAAQLRDESLDRAGAGTTVYLAAGNSGARILAAGMAVDGSTPVFSGPLRAEQTQALQPGRTTLRVARLALTPGTHHLHAAVLLKFSGEDEARSLVLDQDAVFDAIPGDLVLAPEGKNWLSSPQLALHRQGAGAPDDSGLFDVQRLWSAVNGPQVGDGAYRPGSDGDPALGYARLLIATRDHFQAAVLLDRLGQRAGQHLSGAALPPEYWQVLAEARLGCDALAPALQASRQAAVAGLGAAEAASLRVRIAESYYQRQDYAAAEQAMEQAPPKRAKKQYTQWQDLRARLLLAQGRYSEAIGALKAADAGADFDAYVRYYNLGMVLLQNGLGQQGATVLDRIGSVPGNDHDMMSLSDSANLALGFWLLQNGQGATAIPVLQRIELYGRYSDRALLDLGWAWLAPAGTKQVRTMLGDERTQGPPPETVGAQQYPYDTQNVYQRYHLRPFVRAKLDGDRDARIKRALAAWSELLGREPTSEAVQEAYLAAAMALDDIGAHQEAAEQYDRGLKVLETAMRAVDEAGQYVRADLWVNDVLEAGDASTRFDRSLHALPRPGVALQLDGTMAGWAFQSGLQQYRTLEALDANLRDSSAGSGDEDAAQALRRQVAELRQDIDGLKRDEITLLRQQLLDQLALRQRRLSRLLEGSRFELARVYDREAQ